MKRKIPKYQLQRVDVSDSVSPPASGPELDGISTTEANRAAENSCFIEGHEDPEQSAELERQQDS